jgi:hypothetical protein
MRFDDVFAEVPQFVGQNGVDCLRIQLCKGVAELPLVWRHQNR